MPSFPKKWDGYDLRITEVAKKGEARFKTVGKKVVHAENPIP